MVPRSPRLNIATCVGRCGRRGFGRRLLLHRGATDAGYWTSSNAKRFRLTGDLSASENGQPGAPRYAGRDCGGYRQFMLREPFGF